MCNKTIGLNRFQLSKDIWICPVCKKVILKKYKHIYDFADLQKMSVEKLKELAGITPKRFSDEEIKAVLDFCTNSQQEFLQEIEEE